MGAAGLSAATLPLSAAQGCPAASSPRVAANGVIPARVMGRAQTSVLELWDPLQRYGEVSALTSA